MQEIEYQRAFVEDIVIAPLLDNMGKLEGHPDEPSRIARSLTGEEVTQIIETYRVSYFRIRQELLTDDLIGLQYEGEENKDLLLADTMAKTIEKAALEITKRHSRILD